MCPVVVVGLVVFHFLKLPVADGETDVLWLPHSYANSSERWLRERSIARTPQEVALQRQSLPKGRQKRKETAAEAGGEELLIHPMSLIISHSPAWTSEHLEQVLLVAEPKDIKILSRKLPSANRKTKKITCIPGGQRGGAKSLTFTNVVYECLLFYSAPFDMTKMSPTCEALQRSKAINSDGHEGQTSF